MPRSLTWKLTLAFVGVGLTVALLVAVLLRLLNARQFERLVVEQQRSDFASQLVAYYETNGSWQGVEESLVPDEQAHPPQGGGDFGGQGRGPGGQGGPRGRRELFGLVDAQGNVIIPLFPDYPPDGRVAQGVIDAGEPVEVNGAVVGTILTNPAPPGLSPAETAYLRRADIALALAGGGAVLVALLVGVLLARTLTQPLHALTQATHRMAGGELEQEVPVQPGDEIGDLAAAFNQMSREVARANLARRQMTADVAHELRTPLTVIAGYIESMRDGVLAPTAERLSVIYAEIEHLQHLVGDLRTLTQADTGELKLNKQRLSLAELLEETRSTFEHQAAQQGIQLDVNAGGRIPPIVVDQTRMAQVLGNLVSNALRYTPAGGRIALGASSTDGQVTLTVHDTGQGIPAEELPHVFNRLYRVDKSRSEQSGESGLGLSIVKALVTAHGGTITVASEVGQGATFSVHLPAA